jgi:hypothetical protein
MAASPETSAKTIFVEGDMRYEADKTRASKVISAEGLKRDYLLVPDAPTGPTVVADSEGELWMVLTEDEEGVLLAPAKGAAE